MYYYIINPAAGRGSFRAIQDKLRTQLTQVGIVGEFMKTAGPGDATRLAEQAVAKGHNTIVVIGGDETVNEVINGIDSDKVAVGIIPTGSSNKLAHHLGINDWQQAIPILAARRLTSYALLAAGQKYFLSTLTIGLETDLDKKLDTQDSGLTSRLSQFRQGWQHARSYESIHCALKLDDKLDIECDFFSMSISNLKYLNAGAENQLVIHIYEQPSRRQLTSYLWSWLKQNSPIEDVATTRLFANRVLIDTLPSTGITVDGKVAGRTPMAIRLTERKIRFICNKPNNSLNPKG